MYKKARAVKTFEYQSETEFPPKKSEARIVFRHNLCERTESFIL